MPLRGEGSCGALDPPASAGFLASPAGSLGCSQTCLPTSFPKASQLPLSQNTGLPQPILSLWAHEIPRWGPCRAWPEEPGPEFSSPLTRPPTPCVTAPSRSTESWVGQSSACSSERVWPLRASCLCCFYHGLEVAGAEGAWRAPGGPGSWDSPEGQWLGSLDLRPHQRCGPVPSGPQRAS